MFEVVDVGAVVVIFEVVDDPVLDVGVVVVGFEVVVVVVKVIV